MDLAVIRKQGSINKIYFYVILDSLACIGLRYSVRHAKMYKVLIGGYKDEKTARDALVKVRKHINEGAFVVKL